MSAQNRNHHHVHAMLIFPPVWVPMVPHLAVPALTAYLRRHHFVVKPVDANVEFFVDYLLSKDILPDLASSVQMGLDGNGGPQLPPAWLHLLKREFPMWKASIPQVDRILDVFRDEQRFFEPDELLRARELVHGFLYLASVARWPGNISFNHYRRGDIWTSQDLLTLCEDPSRNVFLPFWRDRVLPVIRQASPLAVGISISSIHQFIAALTLARLIRVELPHIHVVVGGKHLLRIQDKLLQHPFYFRDFFHSAILHEGERPLVELLETLQRGKPLQRVPNLIYMDHEGPIQTPFCDPEPLDRVPYPDFDDIQWDRYLTPRRYIPIRMSDGCYWGKCTFCARYGPDRIAYMLPDRVVEGLEHHQETYGIKDVSVNDDCMPPDYWEELCQKISSRKLKLSMLIWAKPVAGFTRRRLELMAKAGVRQIRWGVESAHPRILGLMRKGTTVSTTLRVLQDAHDLGMWNHACIILGFPTETREEAQQTLDLIGNHRAIIQSFILYPFVLYEHSYIYQHPEEFGIREIQLEPTPFFDRISYTTDAGLTPQEARALARNAKETLLDQVYGWPFWYYLKIREYLQFYLDRYGLEGTLRIPFNRKGLLRSLEAPVQ